MSPVHALMRDMGDAHVLAAALRHRCDFVCTGNTRDRRQEGGQRPPGKAASW